MFKRETLGAATLPLSNVTPENPGVSHPNCTHGIELEEKLLPRTYVMRLPALDTWHALNAKYRLLTRHICGGGRRHRRCRQRRPLCSCHPMKSNCLPAISTILHCTTHLHHHEDTTTTSCDADRRWWYKLNGLTDLNSSFCNSNLKSCHSMSYVLYRW
jgi:hypothetical protein